MSEEELIKTLIDEFNNMFTREHLETNPYIVFKMNSSLEIPVTAIYKDKKISSICTNLAIIREALTQSTSLTYNREKEVITPNIPKLKNKIVINKISDLEKDKIFKTIYQSPEFIHKSSDKYIENLKNYILVLRTEQQAQSLHDKIKAALNPDSHVDLHLEHEDLYLDLLQKAQEMMKTYNVNPEAQSNFPYDAYYQNYGYYYGMNPYGGAYGGMMGGQYGYRGAANYNQYYNSYQNQMFIRKAQDEANETEHQRGEHHSYSGKKKDRYSKKPFFPQKQLRSETKNKNQMSPEEITRRTRVNSENFPPLVMGEKLERLEQESKAEETGPQERIKHHKDDIIKLFKEVEASVKPNALLFRFKEQDVPVLNLGAKPNLEFIQPTVISVRKGSEMSARKGSEMSGRKNSEMSGRKNSEAYNKKNKEDDKY